MNESLRWWFRNSINSDSKLAIPTAQFMTPVIDKNGEHKNILTSIRGGNTYYLIDNVWEKSLPENYTLNIKLVFNFTPFDKLIE